MNRKDLEASHRNGWPVGYFVGLDKGTVKRLIVAVHPGAPSRVDLVAPDGSAAEQGVSAARITSGWDPDA